MARITVEDCLEKVTNRFHLVRVASKRARQIMNGKEPTLEWDNDKATVLALREIAAGNITEEMLDEKPIISEEEGLFDQNEIDEANKAIDHYSNEIKERKGEFSLSGGSGELLGDTGRGDLEGALSWPKPHRDPFRKMLAPSKITPYLTELLNPGFRLDHNMGIITMRKGAEGHILHGSSGPDFDPHQYYIFKNGKKPRDKSLNLYKTAALSMVANVMLNHDEVYIKR